MKKNTISVKSPALSKMIQEFLFSQGYEWLDSKKQFVDLFQYGNCSIVLDFTKKILSKTSFTIAEQTLDAATQMGELIAMFEKRDITIKDVALENGTTSRDGIISADGQTLTIGCHTSTFTRIEKLYKIMKEQQEK